MVFKATLIRPSVLLETVVRVRSEMVYLLSTVSSIPRGAFVIHTITLLISFRDLVILLRECLIIVLVYSLWISHTHLIGLRFTRNERLSCMIKHCFACYFLTRQF